MTEPIRIDGLRDFTQNLRKIDKDLPKAVRLAGNEAAQVIVRTAKPRVARETGRAAGTVRAKSTRTAARVSAGSRRAPYYGWLDFGGRVGRNRSVRRPFIKEGRYLFPAWSRTAPQATEALQDALIRVAREAGVEVS